MRDLIIVAIRELVPLPVPWNNDEESKPMAVGIEKESDL
jgi:hypothetical protein